MNVNWSVRNASWFPWLWGEKSKTMIADIWWSPLMRAPAAATVGKGRLVFSIESTI